MRDARPFVRGLVLDDWLGGRTEPPGVGRRCSDFAPLEQFSVHAAQAVIVTAVLSSHSLRMPQGLSICEDVTHPSHAEEAWESVVFEACSVWPGNCGSNCAYRGKRACGRS